MKFGDDTGGVQKSGDAVGGPSGEAVAVAVIL